MQSVGSRHKSIAAIESARNIHVISNKVTVKPLCLVKELSNSETYLCGIFLDMCCSLRHKWFAYNNSNLSSCLGMCLRNDYNYNAS